MGSDCLQRLSAEDISNFKEDGMPSGVRCVEPFINGKHINGYIKLANWHVDLNEMTHKMCPVLEF